MTGTHQVQHLKTSSVGFAIWWIALLLLHAVNLGYYALAGALYRALRSTTTEYQLLTYKIGISNVHYLDVSRIHWIVAVVHAGLMAAMVIGSLQARQLVFLPRPPSWFTRIWLKVRLIRTETTAPQNQRTNTLASFSRRMSSFSEQSMVAVSSVFGRAGLLGVDSVYFDHLLLARELLETTLQTIQVYRMSYLLPRAWLIRFYVVLLIANCWSMPMLHQYYVNRDVERRMMSLLCDAVLDVMSSIGVSFWIFATYAPQYNDPVSGFPTSNWFDDVWFTNVQQEFQMMMVVSWADMASRLVFAVGLLQCMDSIKDMLTPPPVETTTPRVVAGKAPVATARVEGDTAPAAAVVKPIPAKDDDAGSEKDVVARESPSKVVKPCQVTPNLVRSHAVETTSKWNQAITFLLEKASPVLFVVLGFAILVVHIVSETREPSTFVPCQLQLHPWFVAKPACSLVELDCHRLGRLSGSQKSLKEVWEAYEFGATARLFVRHCPQLEVPSTLQQFSQVTSLKVYNSTITSWPTEAGFTASSHHKMCSFYAIRTNFPNGELPPGLLTAQFPRGLVNVVTSTTNLQKLPEHLHELWPPGMTLVFEWSLLQVVPSALSKINPLLLSFGGSPIAEVPPEMFEAPQLKVVILSRTKVQELPRTVAKPSVALYVLALLGTNVSTFWSWMEPSLRLAHALNRYTYNAHETRYCTERDAIVAGNRTNFSIFTAEPDARDLASVMDVSTPEKLQYSKTAVACSLRNSFYFPLSLQDKNTALRP